MQTVTTNGTATAAAFDDGRPIIAKTGTTSSYLSAFFLGAIPQASLTVGIFTNEQGDQICNAQGKDCQQNKETLQYLGGASGQTGFGGYWPARIWHSFMQTVYGNTQPQDFQSPQFSGQAWDQMPKAKKTTKKNNNNGNGNGGGRHGNPIGQPSVGTSTGTATSTASPSASASATSTCFPAFENCNGNGNGTTTGATSAGAVVGGGLLAVLPGSLLWNRVSRRRKKRKQP
jgi:membrane peptidoglycan carboxypeptidase